MPKKNSQTYEVVLCGRKEEPDRTVEMSAGWMMVNHRGDLLFGDTRSSYGEPPVTACYRTGSWLRANVKEESDGN